MNTPTLINLPPPPSEPITPSDVPGTPNSAITSLSAISTTAIKDGHTGAHGQGHRHHHHSSSTASGSSTNTLDAERADRISRLAGLERVATVRQPSGLSASASPASPSNNYNLPAGSGVGSSGAMQGLAPGGMGGSGMGASGYAGASTHQPTVGYFDAAGNPRLAAARSTVGSASATASMGGRTTWTSGSTTTATTEGDPDGEFGGSASGGGIDDVPDALLMDDKMSDVPDADTDTVSSAGLSDGGQESLVGFGEGANSTVSGPVSTPRDPVQAARLKYAARTGNAGAIAGQPALPQHYPQQQQYQQHQQPPGPPAGPDTMEGVETFEKIVRDRIDHQRDGGMRSPDSTGLGKFPFEER